MPAGREPFVSRSLEEASEFALIGDVLRVEGRAYDIEHLLLIVSGQIRGLDDQVVVILVVLIASGRRRWLPVRVARVVLIATWIVVHRRLRSILFVE